MSTINDLLACLNAEIDETNNFIDLLEKEAEILVSSESLSEIPALTEAKEASAHQLTQLGKQRSQLLQILGGAGDRAQMDALAATDDELWTAWQILLATAEEASVLNQRNGTLISVHLRHTQQSLEALRSAAGVGDVYTADGKPHAIGRPTPIGKV